MWLLLGWSILHAEPQGIQLRTGHLLIPEGISNTEQSIDLFIHLHGSPEVVDRNISATHPKAIRINITLPGLSSVYRRHFQDPDVFPALLEEVRQTLTKKFSSGTLQLDHVLISSFSAGFGGVRELLKQPKSVEQIDTIIMADSIYAGFSGEIEDRIVNSSHMEPFLEFARQSVKGDKQLIISHTQLFTPEYASTKETAAWLIDRLSGKRIHARKEHPGGMAEWSHFQKGRFHVLEFEGETGEDHMKHLRHIGLFLQMVRTE